jgi:hypothetical protein
VNAYPPAPWQLGGWGVATFGLVDAKAAAAFVPSGVHVVHVGGGKTLGGLFFLAYERGTLVYHELNIVAGLVRVGSRFAFYLPRLYVDSEASLAGGRDIWGVPKELATFDVSHEIGLTTIAVHQGSRELWRLRCGVATRGLRVPLPMPSFGVRGDQFLFFTGALAARLSLVRAEIRMPADGEFAALALDRPRRAVRCENLSLMVPVPLAVPRPAPQQAPSYGTS